MTAPIRSMARQCRGKSRYDSPTDGRMAMLENHGRNAGMNTYFCPHCEFWHVGHSPKREMLPIYLDVEWVDYRPGRMTLVRI